MNVQTPINAAKRDFAIYESRKVGDTPSLLKHAAQLSGRSSTQIGIEFAKMSKSVQKINAMEYVRWKLYDPDRYTDEERAQFLSNDTHWPMIHTVCDKRWNATAEDKVLCDTVLRAGGVPVPDSVAVINPQGRIYPGLKAIETAEELRDLVLEHGGKGLFGKILSGMVSFGAFRVIDADESLITVDGEEPQTYDAFLRTTLGGATYLVQKTLEIHDDLKPYCSAIATVRMINLVHPDRIHNPVAVIKVPTGANIADAFWRPGNLACEVDLETGEIKTVVALNGPDLNFLDDHPLQAGFKGMKLPHWDKLREINERAARIFAPIKYNATDITITNDGPVVVELNYGGGFDLPQNASGRGFLTPEVRSFFEENGYDFASPPQMPTAKPQAKAASGFGFFGRKS